MIALGIPGGYEWLIILAVVLVLFGHRIPGMARSLGSGITEFKRGLKDGADSTKSKSAKDSADKLGAGSDDASKDGPT